MKIKLVIALALLLFFSTYNPKNLSFGNKFKLNKIDIENNFIVSEKKIKSDLAFLYNTSLFLLDSSSIEKELKKISFIESFKIKKIYPNKLKIIIYEKKPIAILQLKKKKFYISENMKLVDFEKKYEFKALPTVFGNQNEFKTIYNTLNKINFPKDIIKNYYYFESKRWDLETYEKKIIKLPQKNYEESLKNFINLNKQSIYDKYEIFDYRINNQLILK
tara:strand:+ start:2382 stop:3038 length:657 start_codon:yes stop_codon:yes gene_type:complete